MKLTVDLNDPKDVENAQFLLETVQRDGGYATASTESPATETPASTAAISTSPEDRQDPENPDVPEVDSLGMVHNPDYHQSPPKLKADGAFKGKVGKKAEYDAAVAAHKDAANAPDHGAEAPATEENTPGGMPTGAPAGGMPGMPGAEPEVEIPPAVVTFDEICARFTAMMGSGKIAKFEDVYDKAGVPKMDNGAYNANALQTDETLRASLSAVLDEIDAS